MHERSAPAARVENDLGLSRPDRDHDLPFVIFLSSSTAGD